MTNRYLLKHHCQTMDSVGTVTELGSSEWEESPFPPLGVFTYGVVNAPHQSFIIVFFVTGEHS
jgi:hypothetical protein